MVSACRSQASFCRWLVVSSAVDCLASVANNPPASISGSCAASPTRTIVEDVCRTLRISCSRSRVPTMPASSTTRTHRSGMGCLPTDSLYSRKLAIPATVREPMPDPCSSCLAADAERQVPNTGVPSCAQMARAASSAAVLPVPAGPTTTCRHVDLLVRARTMSAWSGLRDRRASTASIRAGAAPGLGVDRSSPAVATARCSRSRCSWVVHRRSQPADGESTGMTAAEPSRSSTYRSTSATLPAPAGSLMATAWSASSRVNVVACLVRPLGPRRRLATSARSNSREGPAPAAAKWPATSSSGSTPMAFTSAAHRSRSSAGLLARFFAGRVSRQAA